MGETENSTTQETRELELPWSIYHGKLRPQFSTEIFEIHDAAGRVVVAWPGFDGLDFSKEEIATRVGLVVNAVNSAASDTEQARLREALKQIAESEHMMAPCATRFARNDGTGFECDCPVSIAYAALQPKAGTEQEQQK